MSILKNDMDTPVRESTDAVIADLRKVIEDDQRLMAAARNQSRETLAEKASVAKEKIRRGMDGLREIERKASDQAVEAAERTKTPVRDHPWASLGIMAAAGLVAGRLSKRVFRSSQIPPFPDTSPTE